MTTASTLISDAASMAGVLATGQGLKAPKQAQYLRFLNMMLDSWANKGVDLGIGTLAIGDTIYVDDADLLGITFNMTCMIGKLSRKQIDPDIRRDAMDYFNQMLAQHQPDLDQLIDPILLVNTASYNILNDQ